MAATLHGCSVPEGFIHSCLGLALFGAFASREKTLHTNPGRHVGVPPLEMESSERFVTRHLLEGSASAEVTELSVRLDRS
jgi:hypothetical protein